MLFQAVYTSGLKRYFLIFLSRFFQQFLPYFFFVLGCSTVFRVAVIKTRHRKRKGNLCQKYTQQLWGTGKNNTKKNIRKQHAELKVERVGKTQRFPQKE